MRLLAVSLFALAACACSQDAPEPGAAEDAVATPAPVETQGAAPTRDEDINRYLLQEYPDAGAIQYALAWRDLNGDGADEAIVYPIGPFFCGSGGCNTLVLTPAGPMYEKVGDISVSRTPIEVLDTSSNGWKDLTVVVAGGGGANGRAVLRFDGKAYPGNASMADMTDAKGTEVLAEEPELRMAEPVAEAGD